MEQRILILGLGNELISDDGIGLIAARMLREEVGDKVDVVESSMSGLALLDLFLGYSKAIIIDAVKTVDGKPGMYYVLTPEDLDSVIAPSPHYAGLPEMLDIAERMELDFPEELKIYAIEVADPFTIGGSISQTVMDTAPEVVKAIKGQLENWMVQLDA